MIPNQYGEVFKYDGTIEFKEDVTKTQIQDENESVQEYSTRKSYGDGKRSLLLRPEKQRNMEINSKALLN